MQSHAPNYPLSTAANNQRSKTGEGRGLEQIERKTEESLKAGTDKKHYILLMHDNNRHALVTSNKLTEKCYAESRADYAVSSCFCGVLFLVLLFLLYTVGSLCVSVTAVTFSCPFVLLRLFGILFLLSLV